MTDIPRVEASILAESVTEVVVALFRSEERRPGPSEFIYHTWRLRGYAVDEQLMLELNIRLSSHHLKVTELPATEEGYVGDIVLVYTQKHPTRL